MVYFFARIGDALGRTVEDVYAQNRWLGVRLREKGGERHVVPCHHIIEGSLTAYIDGAGLRSDPKRAAVPHDRSRTGLLTRTVASAGKRLCDDPPPRGMRPARHSSTVAAAMT
jgi:hypothetical protein